MTVTEKLIKLSDAIEIVRDFEIIVGKTGVSVLVRELERLPEGVVRCDDCEKRR